MATYKVRPSKPVAIMGAVAGVAILVFVHTQLQPSGGFIWLWSAFLVGVVGFNLWAAFAKNGSLQTLTSDDDEVPATKIGTTATRE